MNTVELIGYYGGDETHALAAWTSTSRDIDDGKRERIVDLLKMLADNSHGSPFERSMLHFLVRVDTATHIHLLKHRAGVSCLAANTKLRFLNSNGESSAKYTTTIQELYARWNRGRPHQNTQKDALYQKRRISKMKLSALSLSSGFMKPVSVVDVIHNGSRDTFRYESESGKSIECTPDHLFRSSENGWISVDAAFESKTPVAVVQNCGQSDRSRDLRMSTPIQWRDVAETDGAVRVSDRGDIESCYNNRYRTSVFRPKKLTVTPSGYLVVNLPGGRVRPVHRIVLEAFVGKKPAGKECRHLDNNPANNHLCNLAWGTALENKMDAGFRGVSQRRMVYETIIKRTPLGKQDVYDLTVSGDEHSFLANGFVVHNCNGESARYKELGAPTALIPSDWPELLQDRLRRHHENCVQEYKDTLKELTPILGRARAKESARFFLPYANQITLDISFNFRSFAHFLGLRMKPNAQREIRELAEQMLELVKNLPGKPFEGTIAAFGY